MCNYFEYVPNNFTNSLLSILMNPILYSIRDLERFSGIKAHTIRMWEQRYDLLHPTRTQTNIRRYSETDLKVLLNAAALNRMGYKISRVAEMTADEATKILTTESDNSAREVHQLNVLKISMLNFNETLFLSVLQANVEAHSMDYVVENILGPFMVQIGILWQTNTICPSHEHFISNLIRQFLHQQVTLLPVPSDGNDPYVFFLPENELHELGLLYLHYIFRKAGHFGIYLGQNVPADDLIQISSKYSGAHFVGYMTNKDSTDVERALSQWSGSGIFNENQKMSIICPVIDEIGGYSDKKILFHKNSEAFVSQNLTQSV